MHEFASCFCLYRLYPYDTLCTYGVKQLKLLGFSQRHLFGCSLMVDSTGLEPVLGLRVLFLHALRFFFVPELRCVVPSDGL